MGISKNPLLKGFSEHIEKTIVVKQYPGNSTIITAYPDMSRVKPSEAQKQKRAAFKEAVAYAKTILSNPQDKMKANNRLKNRTGSLYHALVKEFIQKPAE